MNRIVIVADLGRVRVFSLEQEPFGDNGNWIATELEEPILQELPEKIQNEVSDQAGEFSRGNVPGIPGGMSAGEEHNYSSEHEKRLIRGLAREINRTITCKKPEMWDLAAPRPICKRLQQELEPGVQACLKNIQYVDLTKSTIKVIEERFNHA